MSNPNSPFGFAWIGSNRGGPAVTGGMAKRKIAAGYNTPICFGDLVTSYGGAGYVQMATTGLVGGLITGVFVGCEYLSTARGERVYSSYWPNGDHAYDGYAHIIPIAGCPPQLFKVQAYSTNFTFGDVGSNFEINVGTQSINGGYGLSGMTLAQSTHATTATLPFKMVDLYSAMAPAGAPGTDDTSNYNIVIVQSNPDYETGIAGA
jgi:hypothetical protein